MLVVGPFFLMCPGPLCEVRQAKLAKGRENREADDNPIHDDNCPKLTPSL